MTVEDVKDVDLVLVRYRDETGQRVTTLAIVGDNTVHLFDAKLFGFSRTTTPQGPAHEKLKNGVFEKRKKAAKK